MKYITIKFPFSTINDKNMVLALGFTLGEAENLPDGLTSDIMIVPTGFVDGDKDQFYEYEGTLQGSVISKDDEREDVFEPLCSSKLSFNMVCTNFPTWLMDIASSPVSVKAILYAVEGEGQYALKYERWRGFLQSTTLNVTYVSSLISCPLVAIDEIAVAKHLSVVDYYHGLQSCTLLSVFQYYWNIMHNNCFADFYTILGLNSFGRLYFCRNLAFHNDSNTEISDIMKKCVVNLSHYLDEEGSTFENIFEDICAYIGVTWCIGSRGIDSINDSYVLSSIDGGSYTRYQYDLDTGTATSLSGNQFTTFSNPRKVGGDLQMTFEPSDYKGSIVNSEAKRPEKHEYLKDEDYDIIQSNNGYSYALRRWGTEKSVSGDPQFATLKWHKFYYLRPTDKERKYVSFSNCVDGQGKIMAQQNLMYYDDINSCNGKTAPDADCAGSLDFVKFKEGAIVAKFGEFEDRHTDEDENLSNYFVLLNHAWWNMYYNNNGFTMVDPHFDDKTWLTFYPYGNRSDLHPRNEHWLRLSMDVMFARENMGDLKIPNTTSIHQPPYGVTLLSQETLFPSTTTDYDYTDPSTKFHGNGFDSYVNITAKLSIGDYYWDGREWTYCTPGTSRSFNIFLTSDFETTIDSMGGISRSTKNYFYFNCKSFDLKNSDADPMYPVDRFDSDETYNPVDGKLKLEILGQVGYINTAAGSNNSIPYVYISNVDIEFVDNAMMKGKEMSRKTKDIVISTDDDDDLKSLDLKMATPVVDGFFENCLLYYGGTYWHNLQYVTRQGELWHWTLEDELAQRLANQYWKRQLFIEMTKEFDPISDVGLYNVGFRVEDMTEAEGKFRPVTRSFDWTNERVRWKLQRMNEAPVD